MGRCERIVGSRGENLSANKRRFLVQFRAWRGVAAAYSGNVTKTLYTRARLWLIAVFAMAIGHAHAQPAAASAAHPLVDQVRAYTMTQLAQAKLPKVEVVVGALDPRLKLAPCDEVKMYIPTGMRLWGKTRLGVRCVKGAIPWNVYLPLTVNVYGPAMVSTSAFPVGHVLATGDFRQAEVNLAEDTLNLPITDPDMLVGRTLARSVAPGQTLRQPQLKARQWFAAGEPVQIRAAGDGYMVMGMGEAITAGLEGQPARVRTEGGRVVQGMPVAERQMEIAL